VLVTLAVVAVVHLQASEAQTPPTDGSVPVALYDLTTDEYEKYDISDDADYADDLDAFREQAVELAEKYYVEPIYANYAALQDTWDEAGGVGPWMESSTTPVVVEQKYFAENPPHIVFVLVDDWGWNDLGSRSTYMDWATPHIDQLVKDGVSLENYYTNELCTPSRGSLLTGKYAWRLGFQAVSSEKGTHAELSVDEFTLAQEMKSAGYQSYIVGKWDMGISTMTHLPLQRGFDYFYGFLSGFEDYYFKTFGSNQDLRENNTLVTDRDELHPDLHSAYLFQTKAENIIERHATEYAGTPMFLYYAMQLIHAPYEVPDVYRNRCESVTSLEDDGAATDLQTYCGMVLMVDEAIANLTCTLDANGMSDNTVLIIASDNGGIDSNAASTYPWRGSKGSHAKGGVLASAIVHSQLIDESIRGQVYKGMMHVTDWMPTLMGLATGGTWSGSYVGAELDGNDMWAAITTHTGSPRKEIIHIIGDVNASLAVITTTKLKYVYGEVLPGSGSVEFVFSDGDQNKESSSVSCDSPYLTLDSFTSPRSTSIIARTAVFAGVDISDKSDTDLWIRFAAIASVIIMCVVTLSIFVFPQSSKSRHQYTSIDNQLFESFDCE
jgi:arylsulfatase A-like enzyme